MDFWIDGKYFQEETSNKNIIQKCFEARIDIPYFCYHEALNIAGSCRMCLVEIHNSPKLVASCAMPLMNDMKIFTSTERVKKARESVLEFLLVNHPLDCPICDQGGECDLQDITLIFGSDRSRFYEYEKRAVFDKNVGPFIKMIMTRCIHCTRCIRFLESVCDIKDFGIVGRGVMSEIATYVKMSIVHELSANVIDLCPVGALTSLPYAFTSRAWELNSLESIDIFDSACSSIRVDYLNNKVMRVLPIFNKNINEDWISNKIRFVYDSNVNQRIKYPLVNVNNKFINVSWLNSFFLFFTKLYDYALQNNVAAFCNNTIETNTLVGMKAFFNVLGTEVFSTDIRYFFNSDFIDNVVFSLLSNFENVKLILFVGINLRTEIPVLNSKLLKHNNIKFFNIGPMTSYSLVKIKNLGNSVYDVMNVLKGKNFLNFLFFFKTYLNSVFSNFLKSSNIYFIIGQGFYNSTNNFFLFDYCKFFLQKFLFSSHVFNLFSAVGVINQLIVATVYVSKILFASNSFIYLESIDDSLLINKINNLSGSFVVYRGHFFDSTAKISNLIFPSLSFFEDKGLFYNFKGSAKSTKKIVHNEHNILSNFYEYLLNFYNFYFLNNFCPVKNIFSMLRFFDFLSIDFKHIPLSNFVYKKNADYATTKFYDNIILSSIVFNFYKTDSYSRNSKNLHLASLDYLKLIGTYN